MSPSLIGISAGFLILALVFYTLEWLYPAISEKPIWRRDSKTDLLYWFFTPIVTKTISRGSTLVVVVFLALLLGKEVGPELAFGFGPISRQPSGLIVIEMLLLGDFISYWMHRWFHGRRMWKFHAVHHCSRQLDWLSSVRLHPVNDILTRSVQVMPLLLLGFPLTALAAYVPFLSFFAIFLHANVPWSFGPLRYMIASPAFHRWHHTSEEQGLDKNFAGLFPIFDLMFGTFYMPKGSQPEFFGIHGDSVPQSFLGQLAYPFRKAQRDA